MWFCRCGILHNTEGKCLCGAEIKILHPDDIGKYIQQTWDDAHIYYIVDLAIIEDIDHYVIFRVSAFDELRYTNISIKLPADAQVDRESLYKLINHLQADYLYGELEKIYNEYRDKIKEYKSTSLYVSYPLKQHLHNIAKKLNTNFFDLFAAYYLYFIENREFKSDQS